MILTARRSGY